MGHSLLPATVVLTWEEVAYACGQAVELCTCVQVVGDGGGGTCLVRDDARSQHQPLGLGGARFRLLPFNDSLKSGVD